MLVLLLLGSLVLTALLLTGPIWVLRFGNLDLKTHWSAASMQPAARKQAAPVSSEAVIQVWAARTWGWRGAFAEHTWIAVKGADSETYWLHEVIGWRLRGGLSAVSRSAGNPDRSWYGNPSHLLGEIRGAEAARLLPRLETAASRYPMAGVYRTWPGPNSNTFVAYLLRELPELGVALPPTAIGKDYPLEGWVQRTPGGAGLQLTLWGLAGISAGLNEGLRLQWLGLEFGIHPWRGELYWPGVGLIRVWQT